MRLFLVALFSLACSSTEPLPPSTAPTTTATQPATMVAPNTQTTSASMLTPSTIATTAPSMPVAVKRPPGVEAKVLSAYERCVKDIGRAPDADCPCDCNREGEVVCAPCMQPEKKESKTNQTKPDLDELLHNR